LLRWIPAFAGRTGIGWILVIQPQPAHRAGGFFGAALGVERGEAFEQGFDVSFDKLRTIGITRSP
jgi:hypothetical protein